MKGHPVLWIPGLDHAGIATQAIVERTLQHTRNITRYDMGRDEFTQLIWQWKAEKAAVIKQQLKTLGATLDWDREYFTIDKVIFFICYLYINIYCYYYICSILVIILLNFHLCSLESQCSSDRNVCTAI